MTTPAPPGAPPEPETYTYVGGTPELDQLLAMEQTFYDRQRELKEHLEEVQARIKTALTSVTRRVVDPATGLEASLPYPRYRVAVLGQVERSITWTTSRRLDTPAFRADHPDLYARYSKEGGTWKLEREK